MDTERRTLTAYAVAPDPAALGRLPPKRGWMDRTHDGHAYYCLPLVMANQTGWSIACPRDVLAVWNGGPMPDDLRLYDPRALLGRDARGMVSRVMRWLLGMDGERIATLSPTRAWLFALLMGLRRVRDCGTLVRAALDTADCQAHFGYGVITFRPHWLFRTTEGHNLWVRGPANGDKDGALPLEGVVETDWLPYTFTMNWKMTRSRFPVLFRAGEPICSLVPYPRGYIETFDASTASIEADPELLRRYGAWHEAREGHKQRAQQTGATPRMAGSDKRYLRGRDTDGVAYDAHQTSVTLDPFGDEDDAPPRAAGPGALGVTSAEADPASAE